MAWWERAKVGDKVVAIEYDWLEPNPEGSPIINVGDVLEIAGIADKHWRHADRCTIYLRFREHWNPDLTNWFTAEAFRPVQSTETGMTILRSLLNPSKQPVKEDA